MKRSKEQTTDQLHPSSHSTSVAILTSMLGLVENEIRTRDFESTLAALAILEYRTFRIKRFFSSTTLYVAALLKAQGYTVHRF